METSATVVRESFQTEDLTIFYGAFEAVKGITLPFAQNTVTALNPAFRVVVNQHSYVR